MVVDHLTICMFQLKDLWLLSIDSTSTIIFCSEGRVKYEY